jgi:hypothetical protein
MYFSSKKAISDIRAHARSNTEITKQTTAPNRRLERITLSFFKKTTIHHRIVAITLIILPKKMENFNSLCYNI